MYPEAVKGKKKKNIFFFPPVGAQRRSVKLYVAKEGGKSKSQASKGWRNS